ncbi:MAG: transcriptional regulator [Nocardioides sp.]|nr:transcriptional regulator [Nocardioides sp.]
MRQLSDARELRALAHPLRMAIVEQLALDGPLTATELADRLDETPANCSWHLRKLAEHGFVEEDRDAASGRRRPWRVPEIGMTWKGADADPDQQRAALALSDVSMGRSVARYHEANQRAAEEPAAWRDAAGGTQNMVWVTPDELAALTADLQAVVMRHHDRLADRDARPEGSRLCELVAWGVPTYLPGLEATAPGGAADEVDR